MSATRKRRTTSKVKAQEAVSLLKVLSSKTRFQIVSLLLSSNDDPCVNEIADTVGISQSATSHQLARLEDKGVVESYRTGQTICYAVKDSDTTRRLKKIIKQFQ